MSCDNHSKDIPWRYSRTQVRKKKREVLLEKNSSTGNTYCSEPMHKPRVFVPAVLSELHPLACWVSSPTFCFLLCFYKVFARLHPWGGLYSAWLLKITIWIISRRNMTLGQKIDFGIKTRMFAFRRLEQKFVGINREKKHVVTLIVFGSKFCNYLFYKDEKQIHFFNFPTMQ